MGKIIKILSYLSSQRYADGTTKPIAIERIAGETEIDTAVVSKLLHALKRVGAVRTDASPGMYVRWTLGN